MKAGYKTLLLTVFLLGTACSGETISEKTDATYHPVEIVQNYEVYDPIADGSIETPISFTLTVPKPAIQRVDAYNMRFHLDGSNGTGLLDSNESVELFWPKKNLSLGGRGNNTPVSSPTIEFAIKCRQKKTLCDELNRVNFQNLELRVKSGNGISVSHVVSVHAYVGY